MSIKAMKLMVAEMEYVLSCINENKVPFDGDDFHEALRLGREAIEQAQKQETQDTDWHFAQWTACKNDLSDYVCVGSLTLAGIEDGEYGTSEIDSFENTIEALQERLVIGRDDKKVPLIAYIGGLSQAIEQASKQEPVIDKSVAIRIATSLGWTPQRQWVELTEEEINQAYADSYRGIPLHKGIGAKLKEKNT